MNNQTNKPCYIFDIDGTLADGSHRNHLVKKKPKNWPAYKRLAPNDRHVLPVFQMMYNTWYTGNKVFICSGRSEDERKISTSWIDDGFNKVNNTRWDYDFLSDIASFGNQSVFSFLMRPARDHREDSIIKSEMLELIRNNGFEPVAVFDDRPRVVKMWREKGIYVFNCDQTAYGEDF